MKDHKLSMTLLFDYYGDLLSPKQRHYFDLYYNQDFSLAEIAEEEGISRQGVYDALSRGEAILLKFEEKTGFVAKAEERARLAKRLEALAQQVRALPGGESLGEEILTACRNMKE